MMLYCRLLGAVLLVCTGFAAGQAYCPGCGKIITAELEAVVYQQMVKKLDSYKTLTGSGPATWTHDHTASGVHDLCGNIWEFARGVRIRDGALWAAENNEIGRAHV